MRKFCLASVFSFLVSLQAVAVDAPNALMRTAEGIGSNTFEILVSPQMMLDPNGTYLNTEIRYQSNEELGLGFGFGAGEIGMNFGTYAVWHVLPDLEGQPAFAILGGMYINRVRLLGEEGQNYFVLRLTPTVSETFRVNWGIITPYAGVTFSPSFRLSSTPDNQGSFKATMGTQIGIDAIPGLRMWTELGLGLMKSIHQAAIGVSYPLEAFEG